jgi:DNA-binding response OmpR family regulator
VTEILNILFVDSDFENYKSIRNGLENKEIYLYYASTAHDSLELFYKNNYRLIVMDSSQGRTRGKQKALWSFL